MQTIKRFKKNQQFFPAKIFSAVLPRAFKIPMANENDGEYESSREYKLNTKYILTY